MYTIKHIFLSSLFILLVIAIILTVYFTYPMPTIQECPDYSEYSKLFHSPKSDGLLGLPFQRPAEACRKFTSNIIESVIRNITSKITDLDLAQLFTNTYPNTLDTTIKSTSCLTTSDMTCLPLSYIITGDINAMWIRDSANQILPYINYIKQDINLKQLFLGTIYMQAHFFHIDPYANAFKEPNDIHLLSQSIYTTSSPLTKRSSSAPLLDGVFERKFEIDSLASFMSLSYQYWIASGDNSFIHQSIWIDAVEGILTTIQRQQDPTFNITSGEPLDTNYMFIQNTDRPTETQFLNGHGQPVKYTGMVKSLFRPSDDATVFPFFIPGNAMLSVELDHLSQLISSTNDTTTTTTTTTTSSSRRLHQLATESSRLSKEIHDAIYKYGLIDHPTYGKIFAYEVDGYGSSLIMDDANIPSLLSLSFIGFINQNDTLYQNTRKLVLSKNNPYYFSGPRGSGIGGPHVGLSYAWPMSQIVRILSSDSDQEIKEALDIILKSTDKTGLIHESVNVFRASGGDENKGYTRSWFSWANGLFGQAVLKVMEERPHLLF